MGQVRFQACKDGTPLSVAGSCDVKLHVQGTDGQTNIAKTGIFPPSMKPWRNVAHYGHNAGISLWSCQLSNVGEWWYKWAMNSDSSKTEDEITLFW